MSYDAGKPTLVRIVNAGEELFAMDSFTGEGKSYLVSLKHGTCSCPDHAYRKRPCKHIAAVRAQREYLLAAAKARQLSAARLTEMLAKYGTDVVIGGALRAERHRRKVEAAADQRRREVFA